MMTMEPIIFESIRIEDMEILEPEPPLPSLHDTDYGLFQELRTTLHDPYICEADDSYISREMELNARLQSTHVPPTETFDVIHTPDYDRLIDDVRSVFDDVDCLEDEEEPLITLPVTNNTNSTSLKIHHHSNNKRESGDVTSTAKRKNASSSGNVRKSDCPVCHKHVRTSNMPRHLRTHAGIHRFRCGVCQLTFIERYAAQQHIIKHHPEASGTDLVVKIA